MFCLNLVYLVCLCVDCPVKIYKITVFSLDSFRQVYRVTDEDLIYETAVGPIFVLNNIILKVLTFNFH